MLDFITKLLKTLFFVFLIIQFVPAIFVSTKHLLEEAMVPKVHVGLINVNGLIHDASFYTKRIDAFLKDEEVKGLILRINSPGGYSGCCEAVYNELKRFGKKKPIVAVIENVGASGAYHLAAAAHTIIASPLSIVGSIGVFMELTNIRQLLESWHVHFSYVQSGKYKTVGSMNKDLSPEEQAYLQRLADDQYNCFVRTIAEARKLNPADSATWADGQSFTGRQALQLKLIDKLGSISDGIEEVKSLAALDHDVKLVRIPKSSGLLRQLIASGDEEGGEGLDVAASVASFAHDVTSKWVAQATTCQVPATA